MTFPNIKPLRKHKVNQVEWNTIHDMRVDFNRMDHEIYKLRAELGDIKNNIEQIVEQKIDKIISMLTDILAKPSPKTVGSGINDGIKEIPLCPSVSSFLRDELSSTSNGDLDDVFQSNEERQSSNGWEQDAEGLMYGEEKVEGLRPKRLSNGDFEPDKTNENSSSTLTAQEKRVYADWPHVILPSQVHRYGLKSEKNFRFNTTLRLCKINQNVLGTLYHCQEELIISMVPYEIWPMHLVSIMSDDFLNIADWARDSDLTWLDLVESIIQNLKKQRIWPNTETSFEDISIAQETDALGIFVRVRKIFYHLPRHRQSSALIRKEVIQKMRDHIPWSFLFFSQKLGSISTGNLIEEVIRLLKISNEAIIQFNMT